MNSYTSSDTSSHHKFRHKKTKDSSQYGKRTSDKVQSNTIKKKSSDVEAMVCKELIKSLLSCQKEIKTAVQNNFQSTRYTMKHWSPSSTSGDNGATQWQEQDFHSKWHSSQDSWIAPNANLFWHKNRSGIFARKGGIKLPNEVGSHLSKNTKCCITSKRWFNKVLVKGYTTRFSFLFSP